MKKLRVTQCVNHTVSWISALFPLFWKLIDKILIQGNSDMIIEKVVTKYKGLHVVISYKRLCFHIIPFLFKNKDKIINFYSLNRLNCKTNFDKQVLACLIDYNYQYALNTGGFLIRTHEKWNALIPKMFHRCLTCVLSVILTDERNKKTIHVSSIKGTYIHFNRFYYCISYWFLRFSLYFFQLRQDNWWM